MFGSHLSIAGGLYKALDKAARLGMDCVQVFTQNQRRWVSRELTAEALETWNAHRREARLAQIVSHGSYLINLATPEAELRARSIGALREEMQRCEKLRIPLLVLHPGSHMGEGEAAGLDRVVAAIDEMFADLDGRTILCLETTAGQGTALGWSLEHLRTIIDRVAAPRRLGVCLDTAHMFAAGYDLTSTAGAEAVLAECREVIGADRIRVAHLNDSKVDRGARVDRHEHIGHGRIALAAFEAIVNDEHIRTIPKILETPKDTAPDGRPWDAVNLETLRALLRK